MSDEILIANRHHNTCNRNGQVRDIIIMEVRLVSGHSKTDDVEPGSPKG